MAKINNSIVRNFITNLLKKHRKEITNIIIISTAGSIFLAFVPFIYGVLFDRAVIPDTSLTFLISLILIWTILALISNYTTTKTTALGTIFGSKIAMEMETESYGHFLKLPVSFHKKKKSGSILEKISQGSFQLSNFVTMLSDSLPSILFMIFAVVAMLIINTYLGATIIFTYLIYTLVTLKLTKPALESQRNMNKIFEKEYGKLYDKVYNVFLIKNFAL